MIEAIPELQTACVEPDIWKIEALDSQGGLCASGGGGEVGRTIRSEPLEERLVGASANDAGRWEAGANLLVSRSGGALGG